MRRAAPFTMAFASLSAFVLADALAGPTGFVEVTASDAQTGDLFGSAVDVAGVVGVIGACGDDDNGIDSGSAYVFNTDAGTEAAKFRPIDGVAYDRFGCAVAMNATWILIGADGVDFADDRGQDAGAAYILNANMFGNPLVRLAPADDLLDPRDNYGFAVAVDPLLDFGVVGAPGDDGVDNTRPNRGAAYLVNLAFGNPAVLKYVGNDTTSGDLFGASVGISGFTVVVGAPFDGLVEGGVYLFNRSADPIEQLAKITSPFADVGEQFGMSLAIDGDRLVVGAPGSIVNGTFSGAAFVYDISVRTNPLLTNILIPSDGQAFDFFGESVAISGDLVVVGAPFDSVSGTEGGSVYVFDLAMGGALVSKLRSCEDRDGDNFGIAVGLDGTRLLVGAWGDDAIAPDAGAVTIYADLNNPVEDCDGNGEPDVCEIADDPTKDCDLDGVLDICQIIADPGLDCNANLVIDACELGPDTDCWGGGVFPDFLGADGVLDECQILLGLVEDCNANLVPDVCEIDSGVAADCNTNGIPDECDIDDGFDTDCDFDGVPDTCQLLADPTAFDCNSNGLFDACEALGDPLADCNADGTLDQCQSGDPMLDCDANGQIDACEIAINPLLDCNSNGVIDFCDIRDGDAEDCNGNERIDSCDILVNPAFFDCDGNDQVDSCEINAAGGTGGTGGPLDQNFNGTLDLCETPPCRPDLNNDGLLDQNDLNIFITAFIIQFPEGDYNDDGVWDVSDITSFLADFSAGCP